MDASLRWWAWRAAWWAVAIAVIVAAGVFGSVFVMGGWQRLDGWLAVAACAVGVAALVMTLDAARRRGW